MAVENQRRIIIRHPREDINFIQVSKENLQLASRLLTPAQLILYIDLCGNADGYVKDYSPAYYKEYYGISKKTAQDGWHALEEKGFITLEDGKYYFNQAPMKH